MADISVELGAALKQSIDAGQITLKNIQHNGLSYNWTIKKDLAIAIPMVLQMLLS